MNFMVMLLRRHPVATWMSAIVECASSACVCRREIFESGQELNESSDI